MRSRAGDLLIEWSRPAAQAQPEQLFDQGFGKVKSSPFAVDNLTRSDPRTFLRARSSAGSAAQPQRSERNMRLLRFVVALNPRRCTNIHPC